MIWCAIDTETTGIPARGEVVTSPSYPHLVQAAGVLYDPGINRELAVFELIVRPEGYVIPDEAAAIHGIDQELALSAGVPLRLVVAAYTNFRRRAELVVGHNVDFDLGIFASALHRCGGTADALPTVPRACTVELGTDVVRLPPTDRMIAVGFSDKFKRPNLSELHRHLFDEPFDGAHSALADCRASLRCYVELMRRAG